MMHYRSARGDSPDAFFISTTRNIVLYGEGRGKSAWDAMGKDALASGSAELHSAFQLAWKVRTQTKLTLQNSQMGSKLKRKILLLLIAFALPEILYKALPLLLKQQSHAEIRKMVEKLFSCAPFFRWKNPYFLIIYT
jgi:hypothetical protein